MVIIKIFLSILWTLCFLLLLEPSAQADINVAGKSPGGKFTYFAILPGDWMEVPAASGTQLTYGFSWGTPDARTCTFRSDENAPKIDITHMDDARAFSNYLQFTLRSNPAKLLFDAMKRLPNFTLESFYSTYKENDVRLTVIYSFDESGVVSGHLISVRSIIYETQLYSRGAFVQITCNMLREAYDGNSERLFRKIRDSVTLGSH